MKRNYSGAVWIALLLALVALGMQLKGCCASTCETMLVECERGLEDLQQQMGSMCSCRLLEDDDGGCELAAAAE